MLCIIYKMATYRPPTEDLPVFDPIVLKSVSTSLTQAEADLLYLHFPNAQDQENLQSISVTGLAKFQNDIIQYSSETNKITQKNITKNTNANILRRTDIYGDLNMRRPTGENGGAIRLWDVNSSTFVNSSQLYTTGTQFALVNLNNSGQITLNTRDSVGNAVQPLIVTATYLQGLKQLLMSGTLATDRLINNCYYQLQDISSLTTTNGKI